MSDIKAGGAFIEIFGKENLGPGLTAARKKLFAFSRLVGTMGATLLGGGTALAAPLVAAVHQYAAIGDELSNVNAQTGASVQMLSALAYSANLAGGGLTDVQGGFRGMAKLAGKAAAGSKEAAKVLSDLGISTADFLAASPDQRMRLIAEGLSKIKDPGVQAATAIKALGRGGMTLLPFLKQGAAGLDEMAKKAASLGLVFTDEEIARADRLGDSIDTIKKQVGALFFQMGDAIAPLLQPAIDGLSAVLGAVTNIIDQNPILTTTLMTVAGVLIVVGGTLLGVAGAATLLGFAITGLTATFTVCGAIIGFILSPIGLIILLVGALGVALVAGAAYFLMYTQVGRAMFGVLTAGFLEFYRFATSVFKGIFDALAAGNLALAGQIAMQGLYVVWLQGMQMLKGLWEGLKLYIFQTMIAIATFVADKLLAIITPLLKLADKVAGTSFSSSAAGVKTALNSAKTGAQSSHDAALEKSAKAVADAQKDLAKLTQQAAEERKTADDKRKAKTTASIPELGGVNNPVTAPGGQAIVTFSASVARLLGNSPAMEAAERTATAAEESRDLLKDMEDDLSAIRDTGGIAFV